MNDEQRTIQEGFEQVVTILRNHRDTWIREADEDSNLYEDYKGIDKSDVFTWFIEALS